MRFSLSLVVALATPGGALAQTTWHVPGDVSSIQEAIDLASSGDTILVSPGTYHENLVISGKSPVLKSPHGPKVTVVDGRDLE